MSEVLHGLGPAFAALRTPPVRRLTHGLVWAFVAYSLSGMILMAALAWCVGLWLAPAVTEAWSWKPRRGTTPSIPPAQWASDADSVVGQRTGIAAIVCGALLYLLAPQLGTVWDLVTGALVGAGAVTLRGGWADAGGGWVLPTRFGNVGTAVSFVRRWRQFIAIATFGLVAVHLDGIAVDQLWLQALPAHVQSGFGTLKQDGEMMRHVIDTLEVSWTEIFIVPILAAIAWRLAAPAGRDAVESEAVTEAAAPISLRPTPLRPPQGFRPHQHRTEETMRSHGEARQEAAPFQRSRPAASG